MEGAAESLTRLFETKPRKAQIELVEDAFQKTQIVAVDATLTVEERTWVAENLQQFAQYVANAAACTTPDIETTGVRSSQLFKVLSATFKLLWLVTEVWPSETFQEVTNAFMDSLPQEEQRYSLLLDLYAAWVGAYRDIFCAFCKSFPEKHATFASHVLKTISPEKASKQSLIKGEYGDPASEYQAAWQRLFKCTPPEQWMSLLEELTAERFRLFPAPLLFTSVLVQVVETTKDMADKVVATCCLFDLMVEHRLSETDQDIFQMAYELLTPELFSIEQRERALDLLLRLSKVFSNTQAPRFIKRALRLACICPSHSALWLIAFAKNIFLKNLAFCLPMLHINPSYDMKVDVLIHDVPQDLKTPVPMTEIEGLSDTVKSLATLSLFELDLLQNHTDVKVRRAAENFKKSILAKDEPDSVPVEEMNSMVTQSYLQTLNSSHTTLMLKSLRGAATIPLRTEPGNYGCVAEYW